MITTEDSRCTIDVGQYYVIKPQTVQYKGPDGKPVADGTYWYLLEFSKQSDDLQVLYSGSILVKRKIN